jgi:uncharacterized protein (TIGR02284 family)
MKNEEAIKVLNKLVEINNDRIEGYETAMNETDESDLKAIFNQFLGTSRKCKQELEAEVTRLGGTPEEGTKNSGKFFRAWMDVKAALTAHDRKAILGSCEFGEDNAVGTYEKVLKNDLEDLNPDQITMIRNQYNQIKADHDKVRNMRDTAAV